MVYGNQSKQLEANLSNCRANDAVRRGVGPLARVIGIAAFVLLATSSAFGEFIVQPIILRQQVTPGRSNVRLNFTLENISRDATEKVTLRIADLSQDSDGVWTEVRPDDPSNTMDMSALKSCKDWLRCTVESAVVDPFQRVPATVVANIPPGTRGFYFAALVAETEPRETDIDGPYGGALLGMQYLVPIILEAQNIPLQHNVQLQDVGMIYQEPTVENPLASVLGTMTIVNTGGTYSRLTGQLRVWQSRQGHWAKVAEVRLPDNGIIPGVKLNLKQDLGILLPSGKYKIEGFLWVDGRRGNGINKEIDFVGDQVVGSRVGLAPIDLDKENVFIDVTPGSTRTGQITVGNGSEDPVTVNVEFILPEHMLHVVNGSGIKGEDLGCVDWVTVQPPQFTMQGYGRRTLNLIVRMPPTATQYSNYYGTLRFHTTYRDGSPAGMRTAHVCLKNGRATATNVISPMSISFAQLTPARYMVTSSFLNNGVTHVTPRCKGILTPAGEPDAKYQQFLMTSEASRQTGIFLPFETRTFSGVLDVSNMPLGFYRLTAVLEYTGRNSSGQISPENQQNQMLIEIYEQDGQKAAKFAEWDKAPEGARTKINIKL
ncbi:MAG TPA: hypothetical protein PK373_07355 [Sedimentisphaerales bacterium]|nr:hypothetical protein [Sedimentisphaerales bacterium]HQG48889.1 hypothetical protein [Sedimentisphaerales bacterium]